MIIQIFLRTRSAVIAAQQPFFEKNLVDYARSFCWHNLIRLSGIPGADKTYLSLHFGMLFRACQTGMSGVK